MGIDGIHLRELKKEDAPLMHEWMQDPKVLKGLKKDFRAISMEDVIRFCSTSNIPKTPVHGADIHYAIADENDEYLGTISLKHVDLENLNAEYAIVLRSAATGKGVALQATALLLEKAFLEMGLHRVYLSVLSENQRAIRLYEKSGFVFEGESREHVRKGNMYMNWKRYGILHSEFCRVDNACSQIKGQQRLYPYHLEHV